jgi:cell division protein FtsB
MTSIRDTCINFFKDEKIKKEIKETVKPIVTTIYNEIYLYLWFICIYHVFLIFIVLANLYLLLRLIQTRKQQLTEIVSPPLSPV